jgi:hypothetical protein
MANKKFKKTVSKTMDAIINWCLHFGYVATVEGDYALFISSDSKALDIKTTLKEFLMSTLDVSKKKLNSLISVLETRGRVYIMFKKRMGYR